MFTGNTIIFFIIEEGKETILNSSQGKYLKVFHIFFTLIYSFDIKLLIIIL